MEEERWKGRWRRVDLDVNYRSPGPDVPAGWKRVAGAGTGEGERLCGRKEDADSSIASAKPDWTALSSSPS